LATLANEMAAVMKGAIVGSQPMEDAQGRC